MWHSAKVMQLFEQCVYGREECPLDCIRRIVDDLPDGGLLGVGLELGPSTFFRNPEHTLGPVGVPIFGLVGSEPHLGFKPRLAPLLVPLGEARLRDLLLLDDSLKLSCSPCPIVQAS